jgi:hypothetical protein
MMAILDPGHLWTPCENVVNKISSELFLYKDSLSGLNTLLSFPQLITRHNNYNNEH